jgi:transcriptional regulator NrdR family protein
MSNWQAWLEAAKKLSVFSGSIVECPACKQGSLTVIDIPFVKDNSQFERVILCRKCGSHNSMRMNGIEKFTVFEYECLSPEETTIIENVKKAYQFSEKVK